MFALMGSQAAESNKNQLHIAKISQLGKTQDKGSGTTTHCSHSLYTDDEDEEDEDEKKEEEDDEEVDPVLEYKTILHPGSVNRVKVRSCEIFDHDR